MGVVTFLRAHLDAVVAVALAAAYLIEATATQRQVAGPSVIDTLSTDETIALGTATAFLLSLAVRGRWPLVPLVFAYAALLAAGEGELDAAPILLAGVALMAYSVGAWAIGVLGPIATLGVGGLVGLVVISQPVDPPGPQEIALPVLLVLGPWVLGLAARRIRLERGDPRLTDDPDWNEAAAAPDSPGRDEIVRDIRDVVERSMSAVVMQARTARAVLPADPRAAIDALDIIDAAGSEALTETQRLTGLLLSPDGTPLPEPQPGLADLDYLAEHVTNAGLPVAMRIEGTPMPLTPDLDAVAYRVVHEALMSTLDHATATNAAVVVRYERDEIQIEISDDGVSTGDDDVEEETAGLVVVRQEVAAIGGSLDAGPVSGGGYWVLARLPIEPDWN